MIWKEVKLEECLSHRDLDVYKSVHQQFGEDILIISQHMRHSTRQKGMKGDKTLLQNRKAHSLSCAAKKRPLKLGQDLTK